MTTPAPARRRRGVRGFTLLEILMAIALIGVATTLFVVSMQSLGRTAPEDDLEAAFWRTMAEARTQALTSRRPVEVHFDPEARAFVLHGVNGDQSIAAPTGKTADGDKLEIVFAEELASNNFTLVRGELVTTRPVAGIKVFPDGTCQAFTVEFKLGDKKRSLKIDPWTGAPMLPEAKAGGAR